MRRWALLVLLVCALAASCTTRPVTEVVVEIDAEEDLRTQITSVLLNFEGTSADPPSPENRSIVPPHWPFTAVLAPRDGDAMRRYRVAATATLAAGTIVVRASSGFAPNRSWVLQLRFERACLDIPCDQNSTDSGDAFSSPDAGMDAAPCAPPASESVDLLLMVDNSGSMLEEQMKLVEELPRLVAAISTGDIDDDGEVDLPPASLHLGVITSDMGSGNVMARTCELGLGDDGILQTRSNGVAPCMDSYPSGTFAFMSGDASPDTQSIGCVARVGTAGCGFEQQLEATLKALTPATAQSWTRSAYVPPRFLDPSGTRDALAGHATGANNGFIRGNSILAILLLTDEDDCSVRDYELFGDSARFSEIPNSRRCDVFSRDEEVIYDVSRYRVGFTGLRRDPSRLVFSAIAGIPPETESAAELYDFATLLAHPQMVPTVDASGTQLETSCSTVAGGTAFPPVRLIQTVSGLHDSGANVSASSTCRETFAPAIDRLLRGIATAATSCD